MKKHLNKLERALVGSVEKLHCGRLYTPAYSHNLGYLIGEGFVDSRQADTQCLFPTDTGFYHRLTRKGEIMYHSLIGAKRN